MDRADDSSLYSKTHPHIINAATIIWQYRVSNDAKKNFTLIYHWQKTKTFLSVTVLLTL